jgi:hypothetical protein
MKKFFAIAAFLLALATWSDSGFAFFHRGGPQSTTCPMGTGFPTDGCAVANQSATFQQPNAFQPGGYFNTTAATSVNYMNTNCGPSANLLCRPPWNVAGVDYPVGNYSPVASTCNVSPGTWVPGDCLMDPQLHPPAGCTIASNGYSGSVDKEMDCTGAAFAGVIQHYNFGAVNGHDCTGIDILNAGSVSTLIFDDNYYFDNSGSCAISSGNNNFWMTVSATFPGGMTFTNNTIDFNNSQWDQQYGPCASLVKCNGWLFAFSPSNSVIFKYNAVLHDPTDIIVGSPRNTSTHTYTALYQYNFFSAWQSRGPNGHKELYAAQNGVSPITSPTNTIGGFTYDHNTSVNDAEATTDNGPTYLYTANGAGLSYATGPVINGNTIINAHVGGRPIPGGTTYTACIGASYSGGCVLGATNNILFVTSENHTLGYGFAFTCGSVGISTYKTISGPYPPGVVEELGIDGSAAPDYYPGWNATSTPQSCSGTAGAQEINDAGIMTGHGQSYGSPVMTNNYIDIDSFANGSTTPNLWDFFSTDTKPLNPLPISSGSISGSTLTTSVAMNLELGLYIYASNFSTQIPGCTITHIQGCPRILNGGASTTTFALDTTFGIPIAAEAMSAYNFEWCGTPAVLSGNQTITGASSSFSNAWLNQLSAKQANSGC